MNSLSRRRFLQLTATATGSLIFTSPRALRGAPLPAADQGISFFLIGDTHYLAAQEKPEILDDISQGYTTGLIDWLNRLPGQEWPQTVGGGTMPEPAGLIHAGDLIDSGNANDPTHLAMQKTEMAAFLADFGLNGGDGRLRWGMREVYGNHDAPDGKGLVIDTLRERNKGRKGLTKISPNGIHHSWDWGGVHFINVGIVVGSASPESHHGVYAPLDSLGFLASDLAESVGNSGRPVIITHHVDVARYSVPMEDKTRAPKNEWDFADMTAYHDALKGYRVAGIFYGHTHVRRVFPWDGHAPAAPGKAPENPAPAPDGIPVFNTAKASHFNSPAQGFFHFQVTENQLVAREFATKDGWKTGAWTPQVWQFALPA